MTHHQIFGGKTDACLPAAVVPAEHIAFGFLNSYPDNHWSNQKLKLVELSNIHSEKVLCLSDEDDDDREGKSKTEICQIQRGEM